MKRTAEQIARDLDVKQAELSRLNKQLIGRLTLENIFLVAHGAGKLQSQFTATDYAFNTLKHPWTKTAEAYEIMSKVRFQIIQCDTGEYLFDKTLDTLNREELLYIQRNYFPTSKWKVRG